MFAPYYELCRDCGAEFLRTGMRMVRCRKCQKARTMELERINSKEYYHRKKKEREAKEKIDK